MKFSVNKRNMTGLKEADGNAWLTKARWGWRWWVLHTHIDGNGLTNWDGFTGWASTSKKGRQKVIRVTKRLNPHSEPLSAEVTNTI